MAKVEIILQGQNNASSAIDETSNALKGLGGVADSVGGALGGLGNIAQTALGVFTGGALLEGATAIVGKLGEIAGSPLDAWKNLDDAADTLTLKLGVTGPALDTMTASVSNLYNSSAGLGQSMGDIASTMGTLEQILGDTDGALEPLTAQLGYMKQVQGEGAVSTESFARALQAWNVPASEGGPLLDKMAAATQAYGISSADMTEGLLKSAGAFQGMGLDVNQTMGLLAGFSAGGLNTEKAIAAMSTAAGKFAKDGVDMRTGLDAAVAAIQHAGTATEATRIAVETFGAKAGPGLATAIQQGKFSLDGLSASLGDTTGALQKTAEATMDFPEQLELMKRGVETALEPLGQSIATTLGLMATAAKPAIESLATTLGGVANNIGDVIGVIAGHVVEGVTSFDEMKQSLTDILGPVIGGAIASFISLAQSIGDLVGKIAPVVSAVIGFVGALQNGTPPMMAMMQAASGTGLSFSTLAPILGAANTAFQTVMGVVQQITPGLQSLATAVGQTLVAAWQAFQQIGTVVFTALQPYLPALQSAIQQVAGVLGSVLNSALQGIASFLTGTVIPAVSTFANWLSANLPGAIAATAGFISGTLVPAFNTFIGLINQYVVPALNTLVGVLNGPVGQSIKDVAGFVANVLVAAWQGLVNFIQGAMPTMSGAVTGAFQIIGGAIQTVAGIMQTVAAVIHGIITGDWDGAWEDAQAGVSTAIDGIKQMLNGAIEEIKSIVVSIVNGIASAIAGGRTDIVSQMAQNAQAAWDSFRNIDWAELGHNIIDGIRRGVENAASSLARGVADAAMNALDAAKSALGIQSPSTVAARQIGEPISLGIAAGIALGSSNVENAALSVVMTGLNAVLSAMASGNAAQAMNEIASLFRAIVLGFAGESEGIGGNAYTHIKRLIDAVSAISGAMGDFIAAVDQLIQFGDSVAGRVALVETGQAYLVWMFNTLAHLAQQMALGAREAANHFINSEVGATLQGLASGIAGIKDVVTAVVGNVDALLTATGGGGQTTVFERLLSDQGGQNWILALVRAIVTWAAQIASVATEAAGEVPMATANLSNLNNTLSPLSGTLAGTVGAVMEVWTATSGGGQVSTFEQLLNSASGRNWILNVISATVIWAVQIAAVATTAAGEVPVATASLQNLNNTLQPFVSVVTSTTSAIKALDDAISNSTVMGVVNGPMSELIWRPYYEMIAGQIVTFAVQLGAAATAAVGTVPQASASLTNLNGALSPFTGVLTSTIGAVKALADVLIDTSSVVYAVTSGPMSMVWQAVYNAIAVGLVTFAEQLSAAVEAALGKIPAASTSLQNLSAAMQPLVSTLTGAISLLKLLSDYVKAPISLTAQMQTELTNLAMDLELLWIAWATVIHAFSPTEASLKAAEAWNKAAGLFADLSKFTEFLKQLQDWSKAPIYLTAQMTTGLSTLTMNLQLLWVQLATALHGFVPTDASMEAVAAWNKAAGLFGDLSRFVEFLGNLRDWVKEPLTLTSQMTSGLSTLTMNLQLLWVQLATALHGFSPSEASLTAVTAWNKAAGLFTDLTRFTEFLAKLRDWAKEPITLTAQMDSTLHSLGMSLQLLWVTWATVMHGFAPTEASLAAAEAWGKAAGLFEPLTRIMDFLQKLSDWTKAPIAYSAGLQGQFTALLTALKSMTQSFVATAQQANISETMQAAADALSDVGGKGMDALGKAMTTIKDLFEFKIESGPGWVQQQGGNNIWSQGGSSSGLPAADAVKAKVDQLMAGLKAILDSVKASLGTLPTDINTDALASAQNVISAVASISQSIHDLMTNVPQTTPGYYMTTVSTYFNMLASAIQELATKLGGVDTSRADIVVEMLTRLASAMQTLGSIGALAISIVFDIPDLGAEIAAIPIPVVHIPVVWDVPPLPSGTSGSGNGSASTSGDGVTVNVNLSTAAGLTGTLSLLTNLAAG